MFERILIPVDFSEASQRALHYGSRLAEKCGSEVFVVHVLTYLANIEQASKNVVPGVNWLAAVTKDLEEFVQQEPYCQCRVAVLADEDACSEILKYSREHDCRLLVVGSHGRSSFMNTLLGSTTQKLMRHSPVPLMIIPDIRKEPTELKFENILIPTDFSAVSLKALQLASQMAQVWNATLHLIHAVDLKGLWEQQRSSGHTFPTLNGHSNVVEKMNKILTGFPGNSKITTLYGDPDEEILKYAKEHKVDFVVMGSHGRKGLDRVLIGSTTASVVRHAEAPVISVLGGQRE